MQFAPMPELNPRSKQKGGLLVVKRKAWERFLSLLYPERCCCCGKPVVCGKVVCTHCRPRLKSILPPLCPYCGCAKKDCRCGGHRRHTDRCVSPFYHEGAARSALHRLKFDGKAYVAEIFCLSMAKTIQREYGEVVFDCIVPVPLSRAVSNKRKYNQSLVLAKGLAPLLKVDCRELLIKEYETAPQRELPAYRRSGNVLGVFSVPPDKFIHKGCTILLVDDTITTGATMDECAKILKIYGAKAVYAVTATASRLSES